MRWRTEGDDGQTALFDADVERHVGRGEFRGMEFLHVRAQRLINTLPRSGRLPFRHTINAYRGCSHACTFCVSPDTPVLMGDGRITPIADLQVGDVVYGTERVGNYRRYRRTTVLDRWSTVKRAWRVTLEDGTELVASGDHRFLTNRGWKHVTGAEQGEDRRPHLTTANHLLGTGHFAERPKEDEDYRAGYLCGMVRGDGTIGHDRYQRERGTWHRHIFRLALADEEALTRAARYLLDLGVTTCRFRFSEGSALCRPIDAIRTQAAAGVERIERVIAWPTSQSLGWTKGFLAGIFDAEGSRSQGVLRIANGDIELIRRTVAAFDRLGFRVVVEHARNRPMMYVRLPGGLVEHLRFFHTVDPAITRKRDLEGTAIKTDARLKVEAVEPLGLEVPMVDVTTGTGDFIADGVVSHNCFARPTHDYLGLDIDEGFERSIVVKVNAVERARAELDPRRWCGEPIAMGTNTDPYQRCEGKYHLTQGIVQALAAARNPFSILTKSTLVLRDADLLAEASQRTDVDVAFSIGTLDPEVWRATEPGTPSPRQRVEAVAKLTEAGVRCGVLVAPVLPGLSDSAERLDEVVAACVEAGAASISGGMLLYLKPGVREVFLRHLRRTHPELVERYEALYPGVRAPKAAQARVSALLAESLARHRGTRVAVAARRVPPAPAVTPGPAAAPPAPVQLGLGLP